MSCPPKVTADSGIDALTHAIEAYTAVDNAHFPLPAGERTIYQGRHPFGDMMAEKAITLIGRHLRQHVVGCDEIGAETARPLLAVDVERPAPDDLLARHRVSFGLEEGARGDLPGAGPTVPGARGA